MKITNLLMAAISCLMISATPHKASRECVNSLSNNNGFVVAVAVNDKYLAITELGKNRAAVYSRDNSGQWVRSKEILLPKYSIHEKVKRGFGNSLQLDGDVLAINTELFKTPPGETVSKALYERYSIGLSSDSGLEKIEPLVEKKHSYILFNVLEEGEIRQIAIPDNGDKGFVTHNGVSYNFAFSNDFLLIGFRSSTGGGGWLFNLKQAEEEPIKIATPNAYTGTSVALNEKFAAVGNTLFGEPADPNLTLKTLVRAIDNGSTAVIDAYGELSLSDNILTIMRYGSLYSGKTNLLKVFRLDNNAKPQLIIEREDFSVERALVQNGSLVTLESHYDPKISANRYIRVCLEPIH